MKLTTTSTMKVPATTKCALRQRCLVQSSQKTAFWSGKGGREAGHGSRIQPVRALDASICLSVAQEEFAFAAVLAAETYLSAKKKKEVTGEDTNLLQPSIAVGVIVAASGLVSTRNDVLGRVGLLFSSIAAFAVIGNYAKRFLEADPDPAGVEEWPGPKGVPAFGIFMSLMAFLASTQALVKHGVDGASQLWEHDNKYK